MHTDINTLSFLKENQVLRTLRTLLLPIFAVALMVPACRTKAADAGTPKVIEVHAKKYEFVPAEVTLTKGVPSLSS